MIGFDPDRGRVLAAPPSAGTGSWAGAPGSCRVGGDVFIVYRLRKPSPIRGYDLRVAVVRERGIEDLWRVSKEQVSAESIERAAIVHIDGGWRLYLSYVDAGDRKWRIALIESATIDGFDARGLRPVLHPDAVGMAAVKDPWLLRIDERWLMFVSCGRAVSDPFHGSGDALSTGAVRSETGLATSADGIAWTWEGVVLATSPAGWDRSTSRLTAAVREGEGWRGYYDGAASLAENYEERCGIVRSADLRTWERVSRDGPMVGTPRGPGGVRYVSATDTGDIFGEHTREDGSHELRGIIAKS